MASLKERYDRKQRRKKFTEENWIKSGGLIGPGSSGLLPPKKGSQKEKPLSFSEKVTKYQKEAISSGRSTKTIGQAHTAFEKGYLGGQEYLDYLRGDQPKKESEVTKVKRKFTSPGDMEATLNQEQKVKLQTADAPPVRGQAPTVAPPTQGGDFAANMNQFMERFSVPEAPDYTDMLSALEERYDVQSYENELAELDREAENVAADLRSTADAQRGRGLGISVVEGRISEAERQARERLDYITRTRSYVADQLNSRYKMIDQFMKYGQQDYQNAVQSYQMQFNGAMKMMQMQQDYMQGQQNMYFKQRQLEMAEDENEMKKMQFAQKINTRQTNEARANLQVMYNMMGEGQVRPEDLSVQEATYIAKLELQSGFPPGFFSNIQTEMGDQYKMIGQGNKRVDVNGKEYYDMIMMDNQTGELVKNTVELGTNYYELARIKEQEAKAQKTAVEAGIKQEELKNLPYEKQLELMKGEAEVKSKYSTIQRNEYLNDQTRAMIEARGIDIQKKKLDMEIAAKTAPLEVAQAEAELESTISSTLRAEQEASEMTQEEQIQSAMGKVSKALQKSIEFKKKKNEGLVGPTRPEDLNKPRPEDYQEAKQLWQQQGLPLEKFEEEFGYLQP